MGTQSNLQDFYLLHFPTDKGLGPSSFATGEKQRTVAPLTLKKAMLGIVQSPWGEKPCGAGAVLRGIG